MNAPSLSVAQRIGGPSLACATRGASDLAAAVSCLQEASLLDPDGRAEDLRQAALWWREVGQLERALSCVSSARAAG